MSLEWRAPSSLRISVFFKITPCSDWDDVEAYLKVAKVRESAEEYYEMYIHELEVIKDSDAVPKEVQRTVRNILSKTNMKAFLNTYRTWVLDNEKEEAEASIAVGYARLAKRAGMALQREDDKKCKGRTTVGDYVVHKDALSDCRQSTPPPCIPELVEDIRFEGSSFWNMIGMPPVWHAGDINISSEFLRAKAAIQAEYPTICLCKDNIADFGHDGELQDFMDMAGYSAALDALPSMPGLNPG
ncbi:hypothetical protein BGZ75_004265 [Mortierella antarctica]|nr:hypothetical protein BGZ75_004265 [Mortierella antarctica]